MQAEIYARKEQQYICVWVISSIQGMRLPTTLI